jgi:hypothetical protein
MSAFRVWVRALGNASRVRVDGSENANWLLRRLSEAFVFKSSEPVCEVNGTSCWTFRVPYTSQMSRSSFERLLAKIPEVNLMSDPE